jgi:hypothetical protein
MYKKQLKNGKIRKVGGILLLIKDSMLQASLREIKGVSDRLNLP